MRWPIFCGATSLFGGYLPLRLGIADTALSKAQIEVSQLQKKRLTRLFGLSSPEDTVFIGRGAWSGGSWPQK